MGKAQSKRSVDITTENKKCTEDEITEKMEKIEDLDKKEVINGDATIQEKCDAEKKEPEEVENDKDTTTEKNIDVQGSGDSAETPTTVETPNEEVSTIAEEISPLSDESIKKSKKEKVKKKWSFRSISFGKKDKQKPAKNEEGADDGAATPNGPGDEKALAEPEDSQKDKSSVNENEEKSTENHENGNATEQELSGQQQQQQSEEKPSEEKSIDITANTTINTTTITTETSAPVQNETAAVSSSESSEKTENMAVATTNININETKICENAPTDDASKNGNGISEENNATEQEPQITDATAYDEAPTEKKTISADVSASTNGEVLDKMHQNGDNTESEHEVVEQSKAQIEVKSNTDSKVFAATLDSISHTSINPSNVQVQTQDLNTSIEKTDEIIQINDEPNLQKNSTNIEVESHVIIQSSHSETVSMIEEVQVEDDTNNQIGTIPLLPTETIDTEKSLTFEDKLGEEPSPPPLPISPPPSQVSVFAFTNNQESVEDSIQTKNSELPINTITEQENKENAPSSPLKETEFSGSAILNTNIQEHTTICNQMVDENLIDNVQSHVGNISKEETTIENEEPSVCKDIPDESQNVEASLAADVIDEITEKAVEIVNQQLTNKEEQTAEVKEERTSHNNEEPTTEDVRNTEIENENTVVELVDNKNQISKDEKEENLKDGEVFECEATNSSKESTVAPEQTNESSLQFYAPDSIQQAQDEMISLNKSDNLDEEHFNPTKEFANAKDLKDNVVVAEITQDLSVTCE